jgi:hypothetical protein
VIAKIEEKEPARPFQRIAVRLPVSLRAQEPVHDDQRQAVCRPVEEAGEQLDVIHQKILGFSQRRHGLDDGSFHPAAPENSPLLLQLTFRSRSRES